MGISICMSSTKFAKWLHAKQLHVVMGIAVTLWRHIVYLSVVNNFHNVVTAQRGEVKHAVDHYTF